MCVVPKSFCVHSLLLFFILTHFHCDFIRFSFFYVFMFYYQFLLYCRCASTFFFVSLFEQYLRSSCSHHRHHDGKEFGLYFEHKTENFTKAHDSFVHIPVCMMLFVRRRITDFLFILVCVGLPQSVFLLPLWYVH